VLRLSNWQKRHFDSGSWYTCWDHPEFEISPLGKLTLIPIQESLWMHHLSLRYSFAPGLKPIFSANPFHRRLLVSSRFLLFKRFLALVSFFPFFGYTRGRRWLSVSFWAQVEMAHRIVSYLNTVLEILADT